VDTEGVEPSADALEEVSLGRGRGREGGREGGKVGGETDLNYTVF